MIKIVAVFDGLKFSEATLAHSIRLAKEKKAHLVGLFLEEFTYQSFSKYQAIVKDQLTNEEIEKLEKKDDEIRAASRQRFAQACNDAGIDFSKHKEDNVAFPSLVQESIYADLVIIDQKETFMRLDERIPTQFVTDFLGATECPVLLVNNADPFSSVAMLFDGSPNSVFAIKQFSYVMGQHPGLEKEVITVKKPENSLHLPDGHLMKEFMTRHFPTAEFRVVKGLVADVEIPQYLKSKPGNVLVVLGAYKRGAVSRWFKESMADVLMKSLSNPLFIAHAK